MSVSTNLLRKLKNAPVPYPTMYNGALRGMCLMHCGIFEIGLLKVCIYQPSELEVASEYDLEAS